VNGQIDHDSPGEQCRVGHRALLTAHTAALEAPAVTIEPDRRVNEAAATMIARGINRLPVVEGQRLVVVTRADLVRAYVRSDEELARAIREDVLLRVFWLEPALFTVVVKDGIASINGRVERRSTAEMIERFIKTVPGIVDVDADVTWSTDDSRLEPVSEDPVFPFSPR
jgi:CBS domain-containing protein